MNNLINQLLIRRILLSLSAVVFIAVAIGSFLAPHMMADNLGYTLGTVDALSEFRAVYVGVWLATAVILLYAAKRIELTILGDIGALLLLGQTFGRLTSLVLDGVPSSAVWPVALLELVGGLAILFLRPRTRK